MDWFKVTMNMSDQSGQMKAIIEMLLDPDCSEFTKDWAKNRYEELKKMDIYEGANNDAA